MKAKTIGGATFALLLAGAAGAGVTSVAQAAGQPECHTYGAVGTSSVSVRLRPPAIVP